MISQKELISRMHEVEDIIGYKFKNIIHLMTVMNRTKVPGKFGVRPALWIKIKVI